MEMNINASTQICGLIGNPVGHSVSPVIHNNLASIYGQNLVYVPLEVPEGRLEDAIKGADAFRILGMNVTVPYKSDVIPFLNSIDPLAEKIGAVNTLVREESGYRGYNTDMPGLYRAMISDGVEVAGKDVILLGAGGVARAVALLLLEKGAKHIYIMNRTLERADNIAEEINGYADREFATPMGLKDYPVLQNGSKYLAIQATNVGMFPKTEEAVIEDEDFYKMIEVGYDIIFNPMDTKFMKNTRMAGGKAYHGLKMLLYQGIIAYELWNNIQVRDEDADRIYELMKKALQKG